MTFEELQSEVYETYMKYYVEGFKNNDVSLIDEMVRYPIAYIKNGAVTMCDSYPIDPKALKKEKGWDHSVDWEFDVTAVNDSEAHAVASAVRCRKDGSKIESVHGFYAFTKTEDGWKMYAVADMTFQP
ncbi:hypothetical protein EQG41_01195 [Billgrantia azerbaijanica]|nr:hypothetical protein EQG41_01195 [Halomonas azerbaijanica]